MYHKIWKKYFAKTYTVHDGGKATGCSAQDYCLARDETKVIDEKRGPPTATEDDRPPTAV